ncbi:MAG: GntR family transcriptional regulator [Planctomycetes bacterium]|nr:GntR family transcriptional regulator [Planctomycetota bacterium]
MSRARQTLGSMALRLLRERIAQGELRPGDRLSDLVLAKEIGISRTPLREAIRQLAADGLVELVPHVGATVRAPSADELEELYELRALLEGHAAARAAGRRTPADGTALQALCDAMEAIPVPAGERLDAAATTRQRELDLSFHRLILELSGLARLRRLVDDAGLIARPFESLDAGLPVSELASACRHHRAIATAIADGDATAARSAMTAHIEAGRAGIRTRLEQWQATRTAALPAALRPFA